MQTLGSSNSLELVWAQFFGAISGFLLRAREKLESIGFFKFFETY